MPSTAEVRWVHVDDACIVADKPGGLLSVPGRGAAGADCLSARVQAHHPDALVVHRLDMATSGLMLFARGADAQRRLARAFAQREVHKRYVAVVAGLVGPTHGAIELPLGADWPARPRQRVDTEQGKPALTRFRVLSRDPSAGTTRLALEPVTGRSHQLRVHLLAIGHPILGDALYASAALCASAPRLLLHATRLRFAHPGDGTLLQLESSAPF
jgi:tRNA pseudouridine32 synthase/23S rRNA pseudouridine746 synthase